MPNPASVMDIEERWRPLSDAEKIVAQRRLDDAWSKLLRKYPDLQDRIDADPVLRDIVIRILCDAVIRVLQNPEGYKQESIDDYSYTRDDRAGTGNLFFTDDELAELEPDEDSGRKGKAFSIDLLGGWPR